VRTSTEIDALAPDLVLAHGPLASKLTGHPTYGVLSTAPDARDVAAVRRALSHDGYLAGTQAAGWLRARLAGTAKRHFVVPLEPAGALEPVLERLAGEHARLVETKRFAPRARAAGAAARVQLVVRAGPRSPRTLRRALESVAAQTSGDVGVVLVRHGDPDVAPIVRGLAGRLPIDVVEGARGAMRSTHLWEGLRAVTAEHFGILDDDDALHPNHVALLQGLLDEHPEAIAAYSGAVRVWEQGPPGAPAPPEEPAELGGYGDDFDLGRLLALENFITSNGFLARTALLSQLDGDPRLPLFEDLHLLVALALRGPFVCSHDTTCAFYWRTGGADNTVLADRTGWNEAGERLARLVWSGALLPTAPPWNPGPHAEALREAGLWLYRDRLRVEAERLRLAQIAGGRAGRAILRWRRARDTARSIAGALRTRGARA
jgi:hypothetical protein